MLQSEGTARRSWAAAGALALGYVGLAFFVDYLSDDGFIVLRYARQALAGHGFVYNPGEAVQGYTCPLWLLLLTGVGALLGAEALPAAARVLGALFGAAGVLLVFAFAGDPMRERGARRLLAPALLAAHGSWLAWGPGGLETTLYGTLLFAGGLATLRHLEGRAPAWAAPLAFGLAALARSEAVLAFGVTLVWLGGRAIRDGHAPWRGRIPVFLLLFALPVLPWIALATAWYGDPVPNTAWVKLDPGAAALRLGAGYLGDYVVDYGAAVVLAPLLLLVRPASWRPWQAYVAAVAVLHLVYVAWVGGDGLAFHRFVAHVAPWLAVLTAAGLLAAWDRVRELLPSHAHAPARAAAVCGVVAALLSLAWPALGPRLRPEAHRWHERHSGLVFPGTGRVHDYTWFDPYFVERQARAARWLEAHAAPGSRVASTPAGAIAFYTRHDVIDMLGLNDAHIARTSPGRVGFLRPGHMKGDGAYVLSRRPTHVLLGNVAVLPFPIEDDATMEEKLVRKSEHELWALPGFHEDYERVVVPMEEEGPFRYFTFYRRRDLARGAPAP